MKRLAFLSLLLFSLSAPAQDKRTVIAVSTLLDGRGNVIHDTRIVVERGKIMRVDANAAPINLDLRGLTVMPGLIDTHVHVSWHFNQQGVIAQRDETAEDQEWGA